eukprot:m.41270 g.41270  ORF g.41270 m.41270 type:complete len:57 (-) comp6989_c1_seq1:2748-2918(-)
MNECRRGVLSKIIQPHSYFLSYYNHFKSLLLHEKGVPQPPPQLIQYPPLSSILEER